MFVSLVCFVPIDDINILNIGTKILDRRKGVWSEVWKTRTESKEWELNKKGRVPSDFNKDESWQEEFDSILASVHGASLGAFIL